MGMALGWSPRVTEQHTVWEIVAAIDGHNRANSTDDDAGLAPPSDAEFDAMLER